jgi:glycosyltransferase involved in cell wall biosynthesis
MTEICVLIPAYNAEATLGAVLEKARRLEADIVVVNDGSGDRTREVASNHHVRVLEHGSNKGKGAALRTGFEYVLRRQSSIVITLDADGQHDPGEIPGLLSAFTRTGADILIASRAAEFGRMTFQRRFWNRLAARAVSRLCHMDITDSQSGFRVIRTDVLKALDLTTSGFETELELLIKACKRGFSVLSIPVLTQRIDGSGSSHFRPVSDTWRECKLFLRFFFGRGGSWISIGGLDDTR